MFTETEYTTTDDNDQEHTFSVSGDVELEGDLRYADVYDVSAWNEEGDDVPFAGLTTEGVHVDGLDLYAVWDALRASAQEDIGDSVVRAAGY